jgi:hypothetical protein
VEAGLNAKKAQQARARKPRVKLYDGTTINEIIADLALSPEHRDKPLRSFGPTSTHGWKLWNIPRKKFSTPASRGSAHTVTNRRKAP